MIISGAVFADRLISQYLTEYIFLGGTPQLNERIYEITKVLKVLKLCLGELDEFCKPSPYYFPFILPWKATSKVPMPAGLLHG